METDGGIININIDPGAIAQAVVDGLVNAAVALFRPTPANFVQWLWDGIVGILTAASSYNVMAHIPTEWTSNYGQVQDLYFAMLLPEIAITTIVLAIQGYRVMQGKIDIWDAVVRTGFFIIVGHTLLFWSVLIFNAVNAMADFILRVPFNISQQRLSPDLILAGILIVCGVFAILTWVKGAVGVIFLAALLVSGPFLLPLSALPIFEGLGKWWAEEFTTWSLRPVMVALVLRLGLGIGTEGGVLQLLFALVAFWLAWTMDSRIRRFSVGAWGSVSQMGLLAKAGKAAAGAFSGNPAAAAAAAAA
mgnify:CR=1 FL=1